MSVVTQWQALSGYFWIYYNTRKNLRKSKPEEWEFMQERPWVVKQFPNIERVMSMRPEAQLGKDIYAKEVRFSKASGSTIYFEAPPWRNSRGSIKAVRGFLIVSGEIEYR